MATVIGRIREKVKKEKKRDLTVEEIKAILTEKGITFVESMKKKDLLALLPQE
mgnify:CR=1 FL=1